MCLGWDFTMAPNDPLGNQTGREPRLKPGPSARGEALGIPECYTITRAIARLEAMTEHHHHHHPHGQAHPPAAIGASILRLSVAERLVMAALLTALVWAAVIWVMR